jgi:hypothetical protein
MNQTSPSPKFPISHPGASDRPAFEGTRDPDQEALWKRAQRRALAYLQVMGAPTLEGHEIIMEALRRAHQTIQNARRGDPVKETMQVLRRLLSERGLYTHGGPQYGRWFNYGSLRRQLPRTEGDLSGGITSMPSLNRGFMSTDQK